MLAAIDTDGRIYFSLSHALTDTDTMGMFLRYLLRKYDIDMPGWRQDTVVLLDNAAWHKSEGISDILQELQAPVIFSAQYSYSTAPIELMFSGMKQG